MQNDAAYLRCVPLFKIAGVCWVKAVNGNAGPVVLWFPSLNDRHRCDSRLPRLKDAHKPQNKIHKYQAGIRALHDRGICVMAGFIAGFDGDTPESVVAMAKQLYDTGVDVPFLSILTPYRGTPAYTKMASEGRILTDRGWEFYNGYNVSFNPKNMSADQLLQAHRALWREAFSLKYSFLRIVRSFFRLRFGAFLMCAMMNGFYCLKRMRGNGPMSFGESSPYAQFTNLPSKRA
jgi:hypothetical protein